ncbi:AAA family ATPase [Terasakiella pusilla]|uniref:AAA family ATPase n=1 Tax=Terasakiella pusilla TaxID=64973 RepID=UPI003AA900A5
MTVAGDEQTVWGEVVSGRMTVETAMDAYDEYRQTNAHADIFENFKTPQKFWVRSTKQRPNPIYPSKAIAGYLLGVKNINGGFSGKKSAAALLYNAGYIIVNQNDIAIEVEETNRVVVKEAQYIRLFVSNYYIEPARERGESTVTLKVGELAKDIGKKDRLSDICQVLQDEEFLDRAEVLLPQVSGPDQSGEILLKYQLNERNWRQNMSNNRKKKEVKTTNLILYGPPGTGKTYTTAWEAVRICLGEERAEDLVADREALMQEYRKLMREGRIEFVTFHQSFSYEDFVEGLRPTTEMDTSESDLDSDASVGGFQLEARDGVFKRVSERAHLDVSKKRTQFLNREHDIYKIALGKKGEEQEQIEDSLKEGIIHLGWGGEIDWSDERFEDAGEIRKEWSHKYNQDVDGRNSNVRMMYAFRSRMQVGDYVVVSDGRDRFQAFGQVTGEYEYDANAKYHPHRRQVKWIWQDKEGEDRSSFYPKFFRRHSVYRLNQLLIDWDALEAVVIGDDKKPATGEERPYVLIIDEINRANISKTFGELITLLEVDKRLGCENELKVRLPYSGKLFGVPTNLHIIGTMNTADRSIALLDTALRRRFTFRELMPDLCALEKALQVQGVDAENVDGINLKLLLSTLNERIEYLFDREHQIGHAYFTHCESRAKIAEVMRYKVIPLLAEYFFEDWDKVAAVLGDGAQGQDGHFLTAEKIKPPKGVSEDRYGPERLRWKIVEKFNFSEFAAQ